MSSKFYVLTKHAWYILDLPSEQYAPFFRRLWLMHRVAHLLVSMALASPRLTYKDFVSALHITPDSPDEVSVALTIIGRELNENDIQSTDIVCISRFPACCITL
jgi:DNA (cytosine-5)-methyltransferase 1